MIGAMAQRWGTPIERFWAKVNKDGPLPIERPDLGPCWVWTGGRKKAGYGQFSVGGKKVIAHRFAYQHFVGPIPEGHEIDHVCRNKSCVRPSHLEAITLAENRRRRVAAKTHCNAGHLYDKANTYWWTDPDGYRCRFCRACRTAFVRT